MRWAYSRMMERSSVRKRLESWWQPGRASHFQRCKGVGGEEHTLHKRATGVVQAGASTVYVPAPTGSDKTRRNKRRSRTATCSSACKTRGWDPDGFACDGTRAATCICRLYGWGVGGVTSRWRCGGTKYNRTGISTQYSGWLGTRCVQQGTTATASSKRGPPDGWPMAAQAASSGGCIETCCPITCMRPGALSAGGGRRCGALPAVADWSSRDWRRARSRGWQATHSRRLAGAPASEPERSGTRLGAETGLAEEQHAAIRGRAGRPLRDAAHPHLRA